MSEYVMNITKPDEGSPRELMLNCLRGKSAGFVPFDFMLNPSTAEHYAHLLDNRDAMDAFECYHRYVSVRAGTARRNFDYEIFYDQLPDNATFNIWGAAGYTSKEQARHVFHPMKDFHSVEQFETYPYPDFSICLDDEALPERVRQIHDEGLLAVGYQAGLVFPTAWMLRGMDNLLMDMAAAPDLATALFDKVEQQLHIVQALARADVDVIWLNCDVAHQKATIMSPGMYREWIKPRLKALYDEAKAINPQILCAHHCCGNFMAITGDFVDIGIDILNPIQPEALPLEQLKADFGGQFVFWGGLSVQQTLPFGSPDDVRQEVRNRIDLFGRDGFYVAAPANLVTIDIPFENLTAFVNEVKKYNQERIHREM